VDPVLLIVMDFMSMSLNGPIHALKMGITSGLDCAYTPRILPVPLSRLKYAETFAFSGVAWMPVESAKP